MNNVLKETGSIDKVFFDSIVTDCKELLKMLTAGIKTATSNLN